MFEKLFAMERTAAEVRAELRETGDALDAKTAQLHQLCRALEQAEENLNTFGRMYTREALVARMGNVPKDDTELREVQASAQHARQRYDACLAEVTRLGKRHEALRAELAAMQAMQARGPAR